jgi:hypothetical protein
MNWSAKELRAEVEEKSKDLAVFLRARDEIRARVMEVSDSQSKLTPLTQWSGTDAVLGSLDLACHAIERTLEELNVLLAQAEDKEERTLRLVVSSDESP